MKSKVKVLDGSVSGEDLFLMPSVLYLLPHMVFGAG